MTSLGISCAGAAAAHGQRGAATDQQIEQSCGIERIPADLEIQRACERLSGGITGAQTRTILVRVARNASRWGVSAEVERMEP